MTERSKGTDRIPQIFEAITCILEEDGLSAVTFNSVAARCYMHKTAIAYYFQGKEDMLIQYFKFMQTQQDSRIPHLFPGCDPVEVFSAFLDNRLHMALLDLPWIRAKYQFLLTSNPDDEFLLQFTVNISSTQYDQIKPFISAGIIAEERLEESMALWFAFASSLRFQLLFGSYPSYREFVFQQGKEQLKRSFLKDELYRAPMEP